MWLWSEQEGVFSHQTALAPHRLSGLEAEQLRAALEQRSRSARRTHCAAALPAPPPAWAAPYAAMAREDRLGWPFLKTHASEIWACDFLQTHDVLFRPIFAFVFIELGSRRVVRAAVTREPTCAWVTQQLRNATAWGVGPRFINDFDALAVASGIRVIRTAVCVPDMNAFCERFLGSLRR